VKLLHVAFAFTLGIAIGRTFTISPTNVELLVLPASASLVVLAAVITRSHVRVALLLLILVFGMVRAITGIESPQPTQWNNVPRNEERVLLKGILLNDPSPSNDRVRLRLQIEPVDHQHSDYIVDVYTDRPRPNEIREALR